MYENGRAATSGTPDQSLIQLLRRARAWWKELVEEDITAADLARRHGVTRSYVSRVLRLSFLASDITQMIAAGEQPAALDATRLLNLHDLAPCWSEQKRQLHLG